VSAADRPGHRLVLPGDCVYSLAARAGWDPDEVWNHPANERLRGVRGDPGMLCPGDRLFVPTRRPREETAPTSQRTRYEVLPGPVVRLTLRYRGEPLADRQVVLHAGSLVLEARTDGDGLVEIAVPPALVEATLEVEGAPGPRPIRIGVLQPPDQLAGTQQRLFNLGYRSSVTGVDDRATTAALRRFQRRHELDPTGEVDEDTRDRLVAEHGC